MDMDRINRVYDKLGDMLSPGKVLVLYGPRQTGKTTLINHFLHDYTDTFRLDTGENIRIREVFESLDYKRLIEYAQGYDLIVIDEAQKIRGVGEGLKIIVDHIPDIRVIVTGSSSFDLAGQIGEPLTGRKRTVTLFPISQLELAAFMTPFEMREGLQDYLVYGSYPEVLTADSVAQKREVLDELTNSYLLKDILAFDKIKNSKIILDLLRLIAFQVGNEVSFHELATTLGIDGKTVARYLDVLEKGFVLYNLRGFSRNLRSEITKKSKYYFWDNGIRNAIIANFSPLGQRNDIGALWENFLIMERLKKQSYQAIYSNNYFWRTWQQHEVDFVEERDGKLYAFEFKWGQKKTTPPKLWQETYPDATYTVITPENYRDFVL